MRGSISKRGKHSWRIRADIGRTSEGQRIIEAKTIRGSKKDTEKALAEMLKAVHDGCAVRASKRTVGDYLVQWLEGNRELANKTRERYAQLIAQQIVPHLGATPLQALRPSQIQDWHAPARGR